jgi:HK97 family phage major capsid protein
MKTMTMPRLERKDAGDGDDEIKNLITELGAESKKAIDALKADLKKATDAAAETKARADKLELRMQRPGSGGNGSGGGGEKTAAEIATERKAFGLFAKTGDDIEMKALATDDGPQAGYLVDTQLSKVINQKSFDQSPMRRLGRVISITEGDGWSEPNDFSDVGAEWVGERASRSETDNPDIGLFNVPLNEVYAHQTVTQKLMDLAYVDIGAWLEGKIADKFARTEGAAFVSGNGVLKPKGFMAYSTSAAADDTRAIDTLQYVNSGAATTITADALRDIYWTLRAPYRGNASWLMNSATANSVDKLKDGNGDYMWRDGMTAGAPPSLLGRPVEIDENMPSVGAGLLPIAFGDFKAGYTVLDHAAIKLLRDPFTDKPNVIVYAYRRVGGGLANSEAIKLLRISAS